MGEATEGTDSSESPPAVTGVRDNGGALRVKEATGAGFVVEEKAAAGMRALQKTLDEAWEASQAGSTPPPLDQAIQGAGNALPPDQQQLNLTDEQRRLVAQYDIDTVSAAHTSQATAQHHDRLTPSTREQLEQQVKSRAIPKTNPQPETTDNSSSE